jgi:hypothetical protein
LKIQKTIRVDEEQLKEIEKFRKLSGGYVTLAGAVENGLKMEIEKLNKLYEPKKK